MKTISKSLLLLVSALVLFTSCRVCLTKRHYRKGYHFEYIAKKNDIRHEQEKRSAALLPKIETKTPEEIERVVIAKAEQNNEGSPKETTPSKRSFPQTLKKIAKKISLPVPTFPRMEAKRAPNKADEFSKKDPSADSGDDARSILWTIAVAIFVIWLIGVLFTDSWAVTSLINIVLLIAIIAFVLWLIRII